tara:strand:+ start:483 stop:734 length:252 start_codon:yes stop_codon:yes gene_type:complete
MKNKLIRCVNIKTNKVVLFPENICMNVWWQKNTDFIPQILDEIVTINQSEVVTVETTNTIDVATSDIPKPKRKYTKKKTDGNN